MAPKLSGEANQLMGYLIFSLTDISFSQKNAEIFAIKKVILIRCFFLSKMMQHQIICLST